MEFTRDVRYEESVWMKVRGGRGKEVLYLCCVYMPTEGSAAAVIEDSYERLKEDVLEYQQKGRVVLLGDFNARVGKSIYWCRIFLERILVIEVGISLE